MSKAPKVENPTAYQGAAEVCLPAFRSGMGVSKAIAQKALATLQQPHRWQISRFLPSHHGVEAGGSRTELTKVTPRECDVAQNIIAAALSTDELEQVEEKVWRLIGAALGALCHAAAPEELNMEDLELQAIVAPFREAWAKCYLPPSLADMNSRKAYKGEHETKAKRRCTAMISIKARNETCGDLFLRGRNTPLTDDASHFEVFFWRSAFEQVLAPTLAERLQARYKPADRTWQAEEKTLKDGHAIAVMRDSRPFAIEVLAAVKQGKKIPRLDQWVQKDITL